MRLGVPILKHFRVIIYIPDDLMSLTVAKKICIYVFQHHTFNRFLAVHSIVSYVTYL